MFMFTCISAEKELWSLLSWNRTKVNLPMSFPLDILNNLLIKYNENSFVFLKTEKMRYDLQINLV